jgi:hypothetical protein
MSLLDVWGVIRGNLACALGMFVVVWAVDRCLAHDGQPFVRLAVEVPCGVLAYCGLAYFSKLPVLLKLNRLKLGLTPVNSLN